MFPAMEADEGRNRQHGAGRPASYTRRKILNRAYRAATWCAGSSFVPRLTRLSTLLSQRGRAFGCPLILRNGRVRAIFLAGDENVFGRAFFASVAGPTARAMKGGLWQRKKMSY